MNFYRPTCHAKHNTKYMYITQSLKNIFMKLLSISQIFILSLTIMSSFYHNMQVTTLLLWLMIFCCMCRLTTCFCGIYLPSLFENVRVMGYNKPVKEQVFLYECSFFSLPSHYHFIKTSYHIVTYYIDSSFFSPYLNCYVNCKDNV